MTETLLSWFREGGPVMVPLLLCSLVALTVILERAFHHTARKIKRDGPGLRRALESVRGGDLDAVRGTASDSPDPLLRLVGETLSASPRKIRGAFELFHLEEERRMSRRLSILETVITLAPLLGILGTVLGIIEAFTHLADDGGRDFLGVAGGLSSALITTATGLGIAILTVIPHNLFRSFTDRGLGEIEEVATFLETHGTGYRVEGSFAGAMTLEAEEE